VGERETVVGDVGKAVGVRERLWGEKEAVGAR
jgi:hypothetical protein